MRLFLRTEVDLHEPTVDLGFVTWISFDIRADPAHEAEPTPEHLSVLIGTGEIAIVHVAAIADAGQSLWDTLDADSQELAALHEVYFKGSWWKDTYATGFGHDLLYVSALDIVPAWQGRNIEFTVVRRLCDTLGQGCELAVILCTYKAETAFWAQMRFEVSTPRKKTGRTGLMHLSLGHVQPRIADPELEGVFKVLPNPDPSADGERAAPLS